MSISGQGAEIAAARMTRAQETDDVIQGVADILDAIEALSLHVAYVEASADYFVRRRRYHAPSLPKASADDLDRYSPK